MNMKGLPRATTMPAVPAAAPSPHAEWAEEAKKAAQRYLDAIDMIERLRTEVEQWRTRALAAERELERLDQRCREQQLDVERRVMTLATELDGCRQTLAAIAAQYGSASKILLEGLKVIDELDGLKAKIDLGALARAVVTAPTPAPSFAEPLSDQVIDKIATKFAPKQ